MVYTPGGSHSWWCTPGGVLLVVYTPFGVHSGLVHTPCVVDVHCRFALTHVSEYSWNTHTPGSAHSWFTKSLSWFVHTPSSAYSR